MIKERPVWGHGPGNYRWSYVFYKKNRVQLWLRYAHNEYLHTVAEYGLIGFLLIGGAIAAVFLFLFKQYLCNPRGSTASLIAGLLGAGAASFAHALFDFNFHVFANVHVLFMMTGLVVGRVYSSESVRPQHPFVLRAKGFFIGAALLAFLLCLMAIQVFISHYCQLKGDFYRKKTEHEKAVRMYGKAHRIDPQNWHALQGLGHTYLKQSFWNIDPEAGDRQAEQAIALYEQTLALNPHNLDAAISMANAYMARHDDVHALKWLKHAADSAQYELSYQKQLGRHLRAMGKDEEALEVFTWARQLVPGDEIVRLNIELLQEKQLQIKDAEP